MRKKKPQKISQREKKMNSNTTKNRKEGKKEVQRKMVLSPSSVVPPHYVPCPLDIAYLSPVWGPRGRGRQKPSGRGQDPWT